MRGGTLGSTRAEETPPLTPTLSPSGEREITARRNLAVADSAVKDSRVRRALPAVAVGVTLLAVWPASQSAFHEPKRWLFLAAAVFGAILTLPRWRWTALPLLALTAVQPWRSPEAGLQALAFAWALTAWPALQPDLRQFTRIAGVIAALISVVVLLQALGLDVLAFASPDAGETRLRLYGTLGNPDFVASALLPIAILLLGPRSSRAESRDPRFLLLLIIPALALTRSFATLLSAIVAASVLIIIRPPVHPERSRGALAMNGVLVLVLLTAGLIGRDLGGPIAGRRYLVSVALPHVLDAPLLGLGLGATVQQWPDWELAYWQARCPDAECVAADPQKRFAALQDHVHDDWLEWLLERGIVGFFALLLALGAPLYGAWKDPEHSFLLAAIAAALTRALVDFPLHRPVDLCLLAGLCALASQNQLQSSGRARRHA